ncbi:expressed unknown protein [Seminavis robusta]|uniref:Uncharacterized protein n=1 Tax=Seminavis robusta TaxID=568900 RepID=A0A9N8H5P9_9STRA|nr:expressed unknown protein [Seminavis robusta]|eukprot:Sro120_g058600.1 n/a (516) ;mRNA; f:81521-83068
MLDSPGAETKTIEQERDEALSELRKLQIELGTVKPQAASDKETRTETKTIDQERDEALSELRKLQIEIGAVKSQAASDRGESTETKTIEQERDEALSELRKLQIELGTVKSQAARDKETSDEMIQVLTIGVETWAKEVEVVKREKDLQEQENVRLKQENDRLTQENDRLKQENDQQLENALVQQKQDYNTLEQKKTSLERDLELQNQKYDDQRKQLDAGVEAALRLKDEIEALRSSGIAKTIEWNNKRCQLQETLQVKEAESSSIREEKAAIQASLDRTELSLDQATKELDNLNLLIDTRQNVVNMHKCHALNDTLSILSGLQLDAEFEPGRTKTLCCQFAELHFDNEANRSPQQTLLELRAAGSGLTAKDIELKYDQLILRSFDVAYPHMSFQFLTEFCRMAVYLKNQCNKLVHDRKNALRPNDGVMNALTRSAPTREARRVLAATAQRRLGGMPTSILVEIDPSILAERIERFLSSADQMLSRQRSDRGNCRELAAHSKSMKTKIVHVQFVDD